MYILLWFVQLCSESCAAYCMDSVCCYGDGGGVWNSVSFHRCSHEQTSISQAGFNVVPLCLRFVGDDGCILPCSLPG